MILCSFEDHENAANSGSGPGHSADFGAPDAIPVQAFKGRVIPSETSVNTGFGAIHADAVWALRLGCLSPKPRTTGKFTRTSDMPSLHEEDSPP